MWEPIVELNAQHVTVLIKMNKKHPKTSSIKNNLSITNNFIILLVSIISLFIESIIIIISFFKRGIFKKEILSKRTDLGFDLIIKRK